MLCNPNPPDLSSGSIKGRVRVSICCSVTLTLLIFLVAPFNGATEKIRRVRVSVRHQRTLTLTLPFIGATRKIRRVRVTQQQPLTLTLTLLIFPVAPLKRGLVFVVV